MTWRAPGPKADFNPWFPTATSGDGKRRKNNIRSGKSQPNARPSQRMKVSCKNCGFPADESRHSDDGGSLSGDGGGGAFTVHASDSNVKEQAYRPGASCPLCFSKAYRK